MVDVFISYSHVDRSWVKTELIPKLEAHAFSFFVDYRDFATGAMSVNEMERAVVDSRHTLAVLTKSYVESDWSTLENAMAQSLDPAARDRKLIPILLEDCKLPLRLQVLNYRDLKMNDKDQWDRLMRDLI